MFVSSKCIYWYSIRQNNIVYQFAVNTNQNYTNRENGLSYMRNNKKIANVQYCGDILQLYQKQAIISTEIRLIDKCKVPVLVYKSN